MSFCSVSNRNSNLQSLSGNARSKAHAKPLNVAALKVAEAAQQRVFLERTNEFSDSSPVQKKTNTKPNLEILLDIKRVLEIQNEEGEYIFDMDSQGELVIAQLQFIESGDENSPISKEAFSIEGLIQWCERLIGQNKPLKQQTPSKKGFGLQSAANNCQTSAPAVSSSPPKLETPSKKGSGLQSAANNCQTPPASSDLSYKRLSEQASLELQDRARKLFPNPEEANGEKNSAGDLPVKDVPPKDKICLTKLQESQIKTFEELFDSRIPIIKQEIRVSRWTQLRQAEQVRNFCDSRGGENLSPYKDLTENRLKAQIYKHYFPESFFRLLLSEAFLKDFLMRFEKEPSGKKEGLYLVGKFNSSKEEHLNGCVFVSLGLSGLKKGAKNEMSCHHSNYHFNGIWWSLVQNDLKDESFRQQLLSKYYQAYQATPVKSGFKDGVLFAIPEDLKEKIAVILKYPIPFLDDVVEFTIYPKKNPS